MPEPEHDLALLTEAAEAAGKVALEHWKNDPEVWSKGVEGPVSQADLDVDAVLREVLRGARPDYGWLGEEGPRDEARTSAGAVFIVDAIDGTRAFLKGERSWAHSLAVARDGQVTAGVVFLPAQGKLYAATAGGPATLNGAPLAVAAPRDGPPVVLTTRPNLDPGHWPGGRVPELRTAFRSSLAYRLCLVAEGRFDAMVTFRDSWEWDIAAGTLIAARAGARVHDREGRPLGFNRPVPKTAGVVAAAPWAAAALGLGGAA